jgi:hypothetical protein
MHLSESAKCGAAEFRILSCDFPGDFAVQILIEIRRARSEAKKGILWPVARLDISCSSFEANTFACIKGDIERAGSLFPGAATIRQSDTDGVSIAVQLCDSAG